MPASAHGFWPFPVPVGRDANWDGGTPTCSRQPPQLHDKPSHRDRPTEPDRAHSPEGRHRYAGSADTSACSGKAACLEMERALEINVFYKNGMYDSPSWCTLVPATLSTYDVGGNPNVNWLTVQLPSIYYYPGSISCIRMPSENMVGFKPITIAFQNRMSDNSDFGIVIFITNGPVNDGKLVGMKNTLSSPSRICRDVG